MRNRDGNFVPKQVKKTFQFISVRKTLTGLFSNDLFFHKFFSEKPSTDGFIRSHRDSAHFASHEFFKRFPFAIRLQGFFYGVEMTNALGSKVKIHEVGNFCYVILNIPPLENSCQKNIFPFALVKTKHLKEQRFDFVIEQFMKELLILESDEGMLLDIPHRPGFGVHGTLVSFCADTKGAHEIGGFMSPSAKKFCRVCHISRNEIRDHGTTDNVVLRTKQSLDYQAQDALDNFPSGDPSAGVKGVCPLNQSNFFHFGENLIFDCMHDIAEGVGPFLLKLCLKEWNINKKEYGLNAACLNERFASFHYGRYDSTNKPSPRFTDANLKEEGNYNIKQRASQSLCALRNFPLMFGDRIPEGDPHYGLLLLFISICNIIFAPAITIAHCNILRDMISELFEQFNLVFPGVQPINKMHHLTHYPDMIKLHGPPTRYWCMRFESFHYILKRRAQFIGNLKNIFKSLACHVQRFNCLNLVENDVFVKKIIVGPPGKKKHPHK